MSGYVILEIIVCLSFIYLLYSLLATIVVEIIAGMFRLRARNLRYAIRRMLQDGYTDNNGWRKRVGAYLFPRRHERALVKAFFNHPHIKYLGKSKFYATPSYLNETDFSRAIIEILASEKGNSELQSIENALNYYPDFNKKYTYTPNEWNDFQEQLKSSPNKKEFLDNWLRQYVVKEQEDTVAFDVAELNKLKSKLEHASAPDKIKIVSDWKENLKTELVIEPETRVQLSVLYKNAGGDLNQFRESLENWYNSVMERSKGWYKQWISKIGFLVGLGIAVTFNLDTIQIFSELKTNTAKRDAILFQAEGVKGMELDSLSDSLFFYTAKLNQALAPGHDARIKESKSEDKTKKKSGWSVLIHLFGLFLTALAISFGAPFWFDLLNKFMKLRTSVGIAKAVPPLPPAVENKTELKSADIHPEAKG